MRTVRVVLIALGGLILAAFAAVAINPPAGLAEAQAIKGLREGTGFVLEVKGGRALRLLPQPVLRLDDVVVTNPAAAGEMRQLLTARSIEAEVSWAQAVGLAMGRIELGRLALREADIDHAIGKDGVSSWLPRRRPATESAGARTSAPRLPHIATLDLRETRIRHRDLGTEQTFEATSLNAVATQAAAGRPVGIAFDAVWNGEKVAGKAEIGSPDALVDGKSSSVVVELAAAKATARLAGDATLGAAPSVTGKARLQAASLPALATWIGRPIPPDLIEGLELDGGIAASTTALSVSQTAITAKTTAGDVYKLERLNARLAPPEAGKPVEVTFDLAWNGETVEGKAVMPAGSAGPGGPPQRLGLTLASRHGTAEIEGAIGGPGGPTAAGTARASGPSLRRLAEWLGRPLPAAGGLEAFSIDGDVVLAGTSLTLDKARLSLDRTKATGRVSVDLLPKRPRVTARLEADALDLDTYIARPGPSVVASRESAVAAPPAIRFVPMKEVMRAALLAAETGREPTPPPALESARLRPDGWSAEPLPLSELNKVDLDLDLTVRAVTVADFDFAVPRLLARLDDGRLTLDGREVEVLGGTLSGTAVVDAREAVPTVSAKVTGSGVKVEQIFTEASVPIYLAGPSILDAEISARGRSLREWVASLTGALKARVERGEVVGWNVRRDWSRMVFEYVGPGPYDATARTPYSRLEASLKLEKGVAESEALRLGGPDIGADGGGRTGLVDRTVDLRFKLQPEISPRWNIPLAAKGSWTSLDVGLDPKDPGIFGWIGRLTSGGGRKPSVAGGGSDGSTGGRDPFTLESAAQPAPLNDPELEALIDRVLAKPEAVGRIGDEGVAALKAMRGTGR